MYDKLYMCTRGLTDIYFYLYECYAALQSLTYNLFGNIHTIYFFDGTDIINITVNYYTNIYMDQYQRGIYYVQTSNAIHDDNFIFDGTIYDVTRYIASYTNHTIEIISYQRTCNRKNIVLLDDNKVLNVNFHTIDRYNNYMMHDNNFAKITDLKTIMWILLNTYCTHVLFIQTFPFKKNTYEIKDVTLDMIYS